MDIKMKYTTLSFVGQGPIAVLFFSWFFMDRIISVLEAKNYMDESFVWAIGLWVALVLFVRDIQYNCRSRDARGLCFITQ